MTDKRIRDSFVIVVEFTNSQMFVLKGTNDRGGVSGFTEDVTKAKRFKSIDAAQKFADTYVYLYGQPTIRPIKVTYDSSIDADLPIIVGQPVKTEEELRIDFIKYIRSMINYWSEVDIECETADEIKNRLEGLAHSILSLIDGEVSNAPGYELIPISSKENNLYYLSEGERQIPENVDIAGSLNDTLFS